MTAKEPGASPGLLLWHATLRWQRSITASCSPWISYVQFVLASTWWLNRGGGHPKQTAVARPAGTDIKMTSQVAVARAGPSECRLHRQLAPLQRTVAGGRRLARVDGHAPPREQRWRIDLRPVG